MSVIRLHSACSAGHTCLQTDAIQSFILQILTHELSIRQMSDTVFYRKYVDKPRLNFFHWHYLSQLRFLVVCCFANPRVTNNLGKLFVSVKKIIGTNLNSFGRVYEMRAVKRPKAVLADINHCFKV